MLRCSNVAVRYGLVQVINLYWNKSERGGEVARRRNAVPSALEIPKVILKTMNGLFCIDTYQWHGSIAFLEPISFRRREIPFNDGFSYRCFSVSADSEVLQVQYLYDFTNGGAPERRAIDSSGNRVPLCRGLRVGVGEWVQVCYNGRFVDIDTGEWWYEQVTINVAYIAHNLDSRMFLNSKPTQEIREVAELW